MNRFCIIVLFALVPTSILAQDPPEPENDFCNSFEQIVEDYPNQMENIRGEYVEESPSSYYKSLIAIDDFKTSRIEKAFMADHYTFTGILAEDYPNTRGFFDGENWITLNKRSGKIELHNSSSEIILESGGITINSSGQLNITVNSPCNITSSTSIDLSAPIINCN
mgnify:CR=1 FL=1